MNEFNRSELRQYLAGYAGLQARSVVPVVERYLRHYQLWSLAQNCDYRMENMLLDGVNVTAQSFLQREGVEVKGSVVILHGYMDHIGLYRHLIQELHQSGFNVFGYDLSGHGLSEGDALAVDDFKHYATQLSEFLEVQKESFLGPLHLVGQSTGAAVIMAQQLLAPTVGTIQVSKRVLLAPLVRPCMWRSIKRKYRWLKYVLWRVPRRLSCNSHDPDFLHFIAEQDPLQHKAIPLNWLGAMLSWGDWLEQHKPVETPIYMIQGTDDGTVDWRHNLTVLQGLYPRLELTLINDAKHHLVNETLYYRAPVLSKVSEILLHPYENGQP